jgi:hypothetical protein
MGLYQSKLSEYRERSKIFDVLQQQKQEIIHQSLATNKLLT